MFFFEVIPGVLGRSVNFNLCVSRLSVSYDYDIFRVVTSRAYNSSDYYLVALTVTKITH